LAIDQALAEKIQAEMRMQEMAALSEEQMIKQAIAESLKEIEKQPLASECLQVSYQQKNRRRQGKQKPVYAEKKRL
jgi:hypothetical protein